MAKDKDKSQKLDQAKHKAVDYQTDVSEEENKPKKRRTQKEWRSLIEERIQEAVDDGRFANLPGHGQPFKRNPNPFADSGEELANGILKNNGYSPEWIERDLAIRKELIAAQETLATAWKFYQPDPESAPGWHQAVARFETKIESLNIKIRDFNLVVPILSKHRLLLQVDEEIEKVKSN